MSVRIESETRARTVLPGAVHGNTVSNVERSITVIHTDRWALLVDSGADTTVEHRAFEGAGAVRLTLDPHCAYAIRNEGSAELHVIDDNAASEPRVLAQPPMRIAGVDGCRGGWVAVVRDGVAISTRICRSDDELIALFNECAVIGIDVPIGLVESGQRTCDHHARKYLRTKSSVFTAPIRPILHARTPDEAQVIARSVQNGKGLPYTTVALRDAVAQVDNLLQRHRELRSRVFEVHPEVSFAYWNNGALESKKSAEGITARRALVSGHFGEIPSPPRGAREDDLLDAFAALWTAERILAGRAQTLGDARPDLTGLPMRIVY
jgi:predicted RNase H-like nuclease